MIDADDDNKTSEAGPKSPLDDDETLLQRLKRWERQARNHWSSWREEARECYDFAAGKQWSSEDKATLLDQMRQPVTFNRIGPMVDGVIGAEILNRQEVRYQPREMGDVQVNEIITGADEWARELADTEDEESDAFADTIICGMGWTETRMDYADDPEGRIVDDRIDPLEMWADGSQPLKPGLSNARYIIRARYRDKDSLKPEWLAKLQDATDGEGAIDDPTFGITGPKDDYDREDDDNPDKATETDKKRVWIRHIQWIDQKPKWRMADPNTGTSITLDREEYRNINKMFLQNGLRPPEAVKISTNCYYEAIIAGSVILEKRELECKHFTFKCITGKRDRNANTFFGVVRSMVDPQMWGNKFFVQIMHILNSSARGGLMYESDVFANPRKAIEDWAKPNEPIELKRGALSGANPAVKERVPMVFPTGTDKMMEFALNNLPQTSGINLEMLGLVEREQAGVLEQQRKKAGYAILSVFFNALRKYRKMKARVRLYFIQNYISDGRLIKINGKAGAPARYIPLVKQKDTATYDVVVDDAPLSPNQKEQTWYMITQLMPMLAKLNVPPEIWAKLIEYSPLPSKLSGEIVEVINQKSQEPPPPDPEVEKVKAQMALANQQAQMQAQIKQKEAQLATQQSAMEMDMERERMGLEMQNRREEHLLEMEKLKAEIAALREKTQMMILVEEAKLDMHADMQQQKLQHQRETQDEKLDHTERMGEVKLEQQAAGDETKPAVKVPRPRRKKKISAKRDAQGKLSELTDGLQSMKVVYGPDGTFEGLEKD